VAEQGTHAELIRGGGYYADLYQKQLLEEELETIQSWRTHSCVQRSQSCERAWGTLRNGRMLQWRSMRILGVIVLATFSILSVGCTSDGVMLQPPVQGEWSNFHNDKKQVSTDAHELAEKPPAAK
jgi:hypothetical protein